MYQTLPNLVLASHISRFVFAIQTVLKDILHLKSFTIVIQEFNNGAVWLFFCVIGKCQSSRIDLLPAR